MEFETTKALEEMVGDLFAEYEPDRDLLKEAYTAGFKAALLEVLDDLELKIKDGDMKATCLTEFNGAVTIVNQDWKTVIENSACTLRGTEWERERLQEVKQFIEEGLKEVNGQLDKL